MAADSNTSERGKGPSGRRVVLVTGSSSGIGRACCDHLSRSFTVYGGSRTQCFAEAWVPLSLDVRDDASVEDAVGEVLRREGRIDALVACAGFSLAGSVEDVTIAEAQAQFDTNYFGTVRSVRAVLPAMRRQRAGRIVVVGSIGGMIGLPYIAHYSATKFALEGLVQALRSEIAPFGIEAVALHPGDINTPIVEHQVVCGNAKQGSSYLPAFQSTTDHYERSVRQAPAPLMVARQVERLLSCRRLPVRAIVGSPVEVAAVRLSRLLPGRSFEYLFRKAYRL
jgi:NAD(P)-dependent dehydrogenase (short-subunit alcohol dehydrogenase family)